MLNTLMTGAQTDPKPYGAFQSGEVDNMDDKSAES